MSIFGGLARAAFSATIGPQKSTGARLLERLDNSTQLEDKREAIAEFRDLSASEPLRLVDRGGYSVLVKLLREEDTEVMRDTLETLANLFDSELPKGREDDAAEVKAMHNVSVFLTRDGSVSDLMLGAENEDVYARYHAVQALMRLLGLARRQTQEAILNEPTCVGRLMGLVEDSREVVRNEVLLLLARLGEGHAGVQNLLGFQGAFDKLLDIIETESAQDDAAAGAAVGGGGNGGQSSGSGRGGVVVHDCLRILSSLVQRNASCCRFFREAGAIARLPGLLALPPQRHSKGDAISVQLACELTSHLLSVGLSDAADAARASAVSGASSVATGGRGADAGATNAPNTALEPSPKPAPDVAITQDTLIKLRLIPLLVSLICDAASLTYPALVVQAMRTLADLVHACPAGAHELLAARSPCPACMCSSRRARAARGTIPCPACKCSSRRPRASPQVPTSCSLRV